MVNRHGIAARLKQERERLGKSQAAFAALGGVGRSTQVNYETVQTSPDLSYMTAIAEAGVDIAYVLTGRPSAALAADEVTLLQRYRAASPDLKTAALAVLGVVALAPGHRAETPVSFTGDNHGNVAGKQKIKTMTFGGGVKKS